MRNAYTNFGTRQTPQSQPIPNSNQVLNNAGGYAYQVDKWDALQRFLILGSEGGTYYVSEAQLTQENANLVIDCVKEDGIQVVDRIIDVSHAGRAMKNDPALFALAIAASIGDKFTRQHALASLPTVARIFTHLAHFAEYAQQFRGWGRGLREAIAAWYNDMDASRLTYQMVKYRQRDGWTHADMLRLAHPKPATEYHNWLYGWAVGKQDESTLILGHEKFADDNDPRALIGGFKAAQFAETVSQVLPLIRKHNLTREMIPTQFLKSSQVWQALFNKGKMPTHALIRNLGNMSASGFLTEQKFEVMNEITEALTNRERIQKSRLHPLAILQAMKMYELGRGRHNEWDVAQPVINALDEAFYLAFDNIEPTGKRILLACDVSGSMGSSISGMQTISCAEGVGALALVTAATEKYSMIRGFTAGNEGYRWGRRGSLSGFIDLKIHPRMRLTEAIRNVRDRNFGATDCALPMVWAGNNKAEFDAFVVLTDNETWAGDIHPTQALDRYNREMGRNAKLVVVSMTATPFSIADPNRSDMLDVVGFDTSTPAAIANFLREGD